MPPSQSSARAPAMQVPLLDLKPQYRPLAAEIQAVPVLPDYRPPASPQASPSPQRLSGLGFSSSAPRLGGERPPYCATGDWLTLHRAPPGCRWIRTTTIQLGHGEVDDGGVQVRAGAPGGPQGKVVIPGSLVRGFRGDVDDLVGPAPRLSVPPLWPRWRRDTWNSLCGF